MSENIQNEQELDMNHLMKVRKEKLEDLQAKRQKPFWNNKI